MRMTVSTATATGGLADKPNTSSAEELGLRSLSFEDTRPPPPAKATNKANTGVAPTTNTAAATIKKPRKKRIYKDSVTAL
jgi:hypothetical protein